MELLSRGVEGIYLSRKVAQKGFRALPWPYVDWKMDLRGRKMCDKKQEETEKNYP